jgi:major intracellular serine protease
MEWSNYGEWIDISAPADQMVSTFPPNTYKKVSGHLVSAGIVTGAVALILSAHRTLNLDLNLEKLKKILKQTAIPIDSSNPEYTGKLGAGMINISGALKKAIESKKLGIR